MENKIRKMEIKLLEDEFYLLKNSENRKSAMRELAMAWKEYLGEINDSDAENLMEQGYVYAQDMEAPSREETGLVNLFLSYFN